MGFSEALGNYNFDVYVALQSGLEASLSGVQATTHFYTAGYSSIGLLAGRARLRFTGIPSLTCTAPLPGEKGTFLLCVDNSLSPPFDFPETRV